MVTEAEKTEHAKYMGLLAPKDAYFPPSDTILRPDFNTMSIVSLDRYLKKRFISWTNRIKAMPTSIAEVKDCKNRLMQYIISIKPIRANECTPEIYQEYIDEYNRAIKEWDDYSTETPGNCKRESINRLQVLISQTNAERKELINLYQKYIDMINKELLKPILKAGKYEHKEIFQDLLDANFIEGDILSWMHCFYGIDYSEAKRIIWKAQKSELLYFIEKYCPSFVDGTRKIKELNLIFKTEDEKPIGTNDKKPKNKTSKTQKIDEILKIM